LSSVEANSVLLTLKKIMIMQKFIISIKEKNSGRDVVAPYIVNSLSDLGNYSERLAPMGLIVLVDSIKEENQFVEPVKSSQDGN
jgi:hypothetical protein